jgi:hypothetical protein
MQLEDDLDAAAMAYIKQTEERERIKREAEKYVWVTKNSKRIAFKDLGDKHLLNILNMLKRKAEDLKIAKDLLLTRLPEPRGDMAQMAFEDECNHQWDSPWTEFVHHQFDDLLSEAERRGLQGLTAFYIFETPVGGSVPYKPK